jgi:hypothetical protein
MRAFAKHFSGGENVAPSTASTARHRSPRPKSRRAISTSPLGRWAYGAKAMPKWFAQTKSVCYAPLHPAQAPLFDIVNLTTPPKTGAPLLFCE